MLFSCSLANLLKLSNISPRAWATVSVLYLNKAVYNYVLPTFYLSFLSVPSAGLTRLVRSRTRSGSSINRSRNRCGTNTSQGQRGRYHTDVSMDSTSNSIEHNRSGPKLSIK